jgi:phytoene dehydrogenase-like protein
MALSKGGAGNLIKALVKTVEDKGGRIVTDQEVTEIKVKKGAATGVTTSGGRELTAKYGVMASITPHQMIKLVSNNELPGTYVQKCRNFRFGPGTLMVHLTLDKPLEWEAAEDLTDFAYIHIAPYMSDIATTHQQVTAGLLPSSPLLVVAQQSRIDPSRAPEGKSILWIQARAFPHQPMGDSLNEIETGDWDAMKEQVGLRIIDKVAQYAPSLKDIIRKMTVHTPQDLEKSNPTLVGGDMVGGSHHIEQNFFLRPFGGWSRYKTPIKRLYMIGHSTWPGGGLNATSGHLGAIQLLKGK